MSNLPAAIQRARRPERRLEICFAPDLAEEYQRLEADTRGTLAEGAPTPEMEALAEQIREASVTFVLRGLGQGRIAQLALEHPPREGDDRDRHAGHNRDSFNEALLRESITEPGPFTDADWQQLVDTLSSGQYMRLAIVANELSLHEGSLPLSLRG